MTTPTVSSVDVQTHRHGPFTIETRVTGRCVGAWCDLGRGPVMIWQDQARWIGVGAHTAALIEARALVDVWVQAMHAAPGTLSLQGLMRAQVVGTTLVVDGVSPLLRAGSPVPARVFDAATGHDVMGYLADVLAEALPEQWVPAGTTREQLSGEDLMRIYLGGQATDEVSANEVLLAEAILGALREHGRLPEGLTVSDEGMVSYVQALVPDQWLPAGCSQEDLTANQACQIWHDHQGGNHLSLQGDAVPLQVGADPARIFATAMAQRHDVACLLLWLGLDPFTAPTS